MEWVYDDGGRSKYFKAEHVGDCVCRAIAIGTGKDYKEVYDLINHTPNKREKCDARHGVHNGMLHDKSQEDRGAQADNDLRGFGARR